MRQLSRAPSPPQSMLELARSQDEEVGDGTTSVIIIAGELLAVAEQFLARAVHPTVIVNAYHRALDFALKEMNNMAFQVRPARGGAGGVRGREDGLRPAPSARIAHARARSLTHDSHLRPTAAPRSTWTTRKPSASSSAAAWAPSSRRATATSSATWRWRRCSRCGRGG